MAIKEREEKVVLRPRCPYCGSALTFDYMTVRPDEGLQFVCRHCRRFAWMKIPHSWEASLHA